MWRCVCGRVYRNINHDCYTCGRRPTEITPFADALHRIELAIAITPGPQEQVAEIEKIAYGSLANGEDIQAIASYISDINKPTALSIARTLKNLCSN